MRPSGDRRGLFGSKHRRRRVQKRRGEMRFFRLIAITVLLLAFVVMGVACTGAKGEKGDQGADGVGIQSIANNTDGTLTIYLTNGQSYTTGDLRGPQGEKGATGAAGAKGDTGVGLSPSYATVDTWETTYDNLTSANLPTVGPSVTVTIGSSGSALVTLATGIQAYTNCFGYMGFAVSGATNRAMNSSQKVGGGNAAAMTTLQSGATYMVTGLNPGVTTFTAKYDAVIFYVGGYVAFYYRSIIVQPL
jgi:hypothetical protein